jgi:hypothetical protein
MQSFEPRLADIYTLAGYIGGEKVLWANPGIFTPAGYASANVDEIDVRSGWIAMKPGMPA